MSGSYFGDSDVFANLEFPQQYNGRDLTAIAQENSTLFIMTSTVLAKIKSKFFEIYEEMKNLGLKRHKKHTIIIS